MCKMVSRKTETRGSTTTRTGNHGVLENPRFLNEGFDRKITDPSSVISTAMFDYHWVIHTICLILQIAVGSLRYAGSYG